MSANENLKEYDDLKKKYTEKSNNKWKINRPFYQIEYIIKYTQIKKDQTKLSHNEGVV